jgi:hypothetical protein
MNQGPRRNRHRGGHRIRSSSWGEGTSAFGARKNCGREKKVAERIAVAFMTFTRSANIKHLHACTPPELDLFHSHPTYSRTQRTAITLGVRISILFTFFIPRGESASLS